MIPGEIISATEPVELNAGLPVTTLPITNTSAIPVHLTAHFHIFEANPCLAFDRRQAWGMRLDTPSTGAVRLEPGQTVAVQIVPIGGNRIVRGFGGAVDGSLDEVELDDALAYLKARGYQIEPVATH